MKQNMGAADRSIRIVLAIVIGILYLTGNISGAAAAVLGIIAIIFLLTSFVGVCPAYGIFGLSTKKGSDRKKEGGKSPDGP